MSDEDDSFNYKLIQHYAADVLGESLATGVPNIIKTPSWPRKVFKFCVLSFCISGFIYQTTEFINYVRTYPSIVDISVHTPEKYLFPAITVCNNNGIKLSKFCQTYPERCAAPKDKTQFCRKYPSYCTDYTNWDTFKVPKPEFHEYENNITFNELLELGHEGSAVFKKTETSLPELVGTRASGPFIFFKSGKSAFSCYTYHSLVDNSLEAVMVKFSALDKADIFRVEVDFEPNETFVPGRKAGGFLAVHSPFEYFSPFDYGQRIKAGKSYKIHLKMEEEELLPYPYKSDCMNYTEIWEANGRKGPRSQEMCKQKCMVDTALSLCNCSFKDINYPYKKDTCLTDFQQHCYDDQLALKCAQSCKDDCQKYKFHYTVQERQMDEIDWKSEADRLEQKTYLSFFVSDPEVVVLRYRPHYQEIEVFSYIGGYIGAWLGISLVAVVDFFECLLLIFLFAFRRFRGRKLADQSEMATSPSKVP